MPSNFAAIGWASWVLTRRGSLRMEAVIPERLAVRTWLGHAPLRRCGRPTRVGPPLWTPAATDPARTSKPRHAKHVPTPRTDTDPARTSKPRHAKHVPTPRTTTDPTRTWRPASPSTCQLRAPPPIGT